VGKAKRAHGDTEFVRVIASEAKQSRAKPGFWIASTFARWAAADKSAQTRLAMTIHADLTCQTAREDASSPSRGADASESLKRTTLEIEEGAGNAGCWPQPMARLQQKNAGGSHHRSYGVADGQER
jgi:hypothetical protein